MNSTSRCLTSGSLLHEQSMSSMDTATSKDADMPMGAEIGNVLQTMSEDVSLLHTLAPLNAIDDITMLSPDPRYKNRDLVDTRPYDDLFVDIQTLEIDAYPNDQAMATYADMSLGFMPNGNFQHEAEESNLQQNVDIKEKDALVNVADQ